MIKKETKQPFTPSNTKISRWRSFWRPNQRKTTLTPTVGQEIIKKKTGLKFHAQIDKNEDIGNCPFFKAIETNKSVGNGGRSLKRAGSNKITLDSVWEALTNRAGKLIRTNNMRSFATYKPSLSGIHFSIILQFLKWVQDSLHFIIFHMAEIEIPNYSDED